MKFRQKVVVVTGSAHGIGRRIATRFHQEGARVVIADYAPEGRATANSLDSTATTALFVQTDVSRSGDVANLVRQAVERFGRLDVFVNNAGIMRTVPTPECSDADWRAVLDVCLSASFHSAKYAGPEMVKGGGGAIVCVASIHGLQGAAGWAAYEAAKGGLIALVRSLAAEFGAQRVRVNAVSPGWILTPEQQAQFPHLERSYGYHQMLRRPGRSDEVASAVLFLASEEAGFITGHNLVVDGGTTAWLCEDQLRQLSGVFAPKTP